MTTAFFAHFGKLAFVVRAMGEPILTFGFALIILNLVGTESIFRKFVSMPFFLFIGRMSYSMYLWHWPIVVPVCYFLIVHLGRSNFYQELAFLITIVFCSLVAMISYRYLEAPYFRNRTKKTKTATNPTQQKII
jgi:peptidoglycan/LPS O-acetylase OafA/YrhL